MRKLVIPVAVIITVTVTLWNIWMIKKYCTGKDPAEKHKNYETIMGRPYIMNGLSVFLDPILCVLVIIEHFKNTASYEVLWVFIGGTAISIFLTLYGSRWILIYTYEYFRYRPVIGKMRTYSFDDVKYMKPIFFDLLVRVGHRLIVIDFQQKWEPLLKNYHLWLAQNKLPIVKKEPKTKLGKTLSTPLFGGLMEFCLLIAVVGGGLMLFFAHSAFKSADTASGVFFLVFAVVIIAIMLFLVFVGVNRDKYPKLAKVLFGNINDKK